MKIAVIGKGKTGGQLLKLIPKGNIIGPFGRDLKERQTELQQADLAIVFVPGDAALEIAPLLLQAGLPVVWGATGVTWSEEIHTEVKNKKLLWVHGHNFSLGMMVVKQMLELLRKNQDLFPGLKTHIHEIHHVHKVDAPSGTALRWKEWLGGTPEMTYDRQGDEIGIHKLSWTTELEEIEIKHTAKDRSLFASGALWCAKKLYEDKSKLAGIIPFQAYLTRCLGDEL